MNIKMDIQSFIIYNDLDRLAEALDLIDEDDRLLRDILCNKKMRFYETMYEAKRIDVQIFKDTINEVFDRLKEFPIESVKSVLIKWNDEHGIKLNVELFNK